MAALCEGGNEPSGSLKAISLETLADYSPLRVVNNDQPWRSRVTISDTILAADWNIHRKSCNIGVSCALQALDTTIQRNSLQDYRQVSPMVGLPPYVASGQALHGISSMSLEQLYRCNSIPRALFVKADCAMSRNASPFLLQHGTQLDNGSWPHVSAATMQWYADNNVHRLDWPAQSPDLNPIEHLWDELDRRLRYREMRPTSIVQLSAMLQKEWRRIPVDILYKLVESMPDRVAAVTATRGSTTRF
ncbi:hypothetical protein ANN_24968 [Periplaneta americana]|uniref:Tc1-like transposase DDE domain-containing protein n=1 Tax=Periplaneta americana TaxID=6978 RepID=A0ABQ8S023_PERAM|nr:hypothetical protein ANN_24968 [Periplaneta americana]